MLPSSVLRTRTDDQAPAVTTMELFFDLVYVFAITQLSHTLLHHLTVRGAVEALVLFVAVWWAWNYTAWATNWIDPDQPHVRVLMLTLMLLSLIMSAAIPEAFTTRAWAFALAYSGIQLLRSGFMVVALRGRVMGRNYAQLLAWSAFATVFFVAGAAVDGNARLALWIIALAVDLSGPMHSFWLPHWGATDLSEWTLAGAHLAERCQLVLLIALGESILATGASFADSSITGTIVLAFCVGFLLNVSLWLMYFARHAEAATRTIASSRDAARIGRSAYAYAHAVMVGGVIVSAVGIDLAIAEPSAVSSATTAAVIVGGPAIYVAGNLMFKHALTGEVLRDRVIALVLLAALFALAGTATRLELMVAATAVTLGLALASAREVSPST
jgi:low temperature requirement protein LtrA